VSLEEGSTDILVEGESEVFVEYRNALRNILGLRRVLDRACKESLEPL